MRDKKVKIEIDGNLIKIEDFLSDTNKTYYAEPIKDGEIEGVRPIAEVVKKQILTDIRDYLEKTKETWKENNEILGTDLPLFALNRFIYDLAEYAEKLGVKL